MNTVHLIGCLITLQFLDSEVMNQIIAEASVINPQLGAYVSLSLKITVFVVYLYVTVIKGKGVKKNDVN